MDQTVTLHTRESQSRTLPQLAKIAANLPGMIFQFVRRLDGSQFVLYASSGCQELSQLEPEVVQKDFPALLKFIHPQDVKAFEESIDTSYTQMTPWRWSGRIVTQGGIKWIQAASHPEKQPSGEVIWDGLLMDITDRKLAEEKFKESQTRYKAILDAIPDLMFRVSRDGEYLDFKAQEANATIPFDEVVGKNLRDILPGDVALKGLEAIAKTLSTKTLHSLEYQLPTQEGMRDYEARLVVSGEDEVLAIVRDITERKAADVLTQNLAEKFQKAFRCSPNPITISKLDDGRYIEVNESFERLSGYSRAEAIGRTAFELNIWVNQSSRTSLLQQLREKGTVRDFEFEFKRKSGDVGVGMVWAEIIDLDGVECILAVTHDITQRKQAEKQLRFAEEKFSKAFRCSPNPITILTLRDERYVDVNDAFLEVSGFSFEEVIGRTRRELNIWVKQDDSAKIQLLLQKQGFVRNLEIEFYTKSGSPRVVLFSAEIITLGGEACLLCVTNDIKERKITEELLKLSAKRDRLLAETLKRIRSSLDTEQILQTSVNEVRQFLQADRVFIGLMDTKNQGQVVAESVDSNYRSISGWVINDDSCFEELREFFSKNPVRIVEDTTQIAQCSKMAEYFAPYKIKAILAVPIMEGEELLGVLVAHQCRSVRHWTGMEIDLLLQMSEQVAIAIQQARLYQELALLNSNLERQVQERTAQLQQKMQELQELHRVKDVVLHTVVHDLRTSVMGNLMVLQNLLKSGEDKKVIPNPHSSQSAGTQASPQIPVPQVIIKRMIQGNDRFLTLIDSLLEIHSGEEQGIVLRRQAVNFSTLVQEILKDLQPMLTENQATVRNLVAENLPPVFVEAVKLRKSIVNLLTYNCQHNPPGLNFTLKARVEAGMIRCTIQNNGVGMSKLECASLFDLYVRDPQASCSTGSSLKLYLCRQIIQAHGGEIGATVNSKGGLSFYFTLPLAT